MACDLSGLLTRNYELEESRQLFSSFISGDDSFNHCFYNLYSFDYKVVFGSESKIKFLYNILKKYYQNDFFIRYSFINKVLCKSQSISFEEFPLKNSRVDLASINGKSVAYEIKSNFDNFDRLIKQVNDYAKFFEYVYVICSSDKLDYLPNNLPGFCGIITYRGKNRISFKIIKKALHSDIIDPFLQLSVLRKREKNDVFLANDTSDIINNYSPEYINTAFKKILKGRFEARWNSLKLVANSLE